MVAGEPRRSIWFGKPFEGPKGKNKGKKGRGKSKKEEPPWRRPARGKGKAAEPDEESGAAEELPEERPEIVAPPSEEEEDTLSAEPAAESEADWGGSQAASPPSSEPEALPSGHRGPEPARGSREEEKEEEEELGQYTNEDKKEDLHPPQKRQFEPEAADFDLEQKDQSEDESVWGDWGSGGRIQPEPEPKVARTPRPSGSRWWLSATGKDKRRSQSSRQFRILKGLLKLAQKKEEEPSAELQEEIENFGQAPWKRRRVQPKTPPKSPPKSSPAPKTPPKGFTKAQRKEPSPGAEPELLTPVAEAAKALGRRVTVHRNIQELAVARTSRGEGTSEQNLASNYRLRKAASAEAAYRAGATGSVAKAIQQSVLQLDGLGNPCSSCDERTRLQRPSLLARAAAIAKGATRGRAPVRTTSKSVPEAIAKPQVKPPPAKAATEAKVPPPLPNPKRALKEKAHIAKPKSEPKVSLVPKWVLKEKAHVEKPESEPKVSLARPKNPPKRPPPPPPVPSPTTPLSETEGSVRLHDQPASEPRSAPNSGSSSGSYYSTEESGKAD